MVNWIKGAPGMAGTYLVASDVLQEVAQARWKPRLGKWTFPSAAMAFNVTHWRDMPKPPPSQCTQQEPK